MKGRVLVTGWRDLVREGKVKGVALERPCVCSLARLEVKLSLEQALKVRRGIEVPLFSFLNLGTRRSWMVNAAPKQLYPPVITQYPSYRRLGGPQHNLDGCGITRLHRNSIPGPSSP
jgi:hypothetical protein